MSLVRSKDTGPEILLRRKLHAAGYRYRLHVKTLPGKPDLVFPKREAVIFVNGCFWHGHDCHRFSWPKTRKDFWHKKIRGNQKRDLRIKGDLLDAGWRVGIIWTCAIKGKTRLPEDKMIQDCADWLNSNERLLTIEGREQSRH